MRRTHIISLLLIFTAQAMAAPFVITEKSLLKLAKDSKAPGLRQTDIELLNAKEAKGKIKDNLTPNLYAFGMRGQDNAQGLTQFMPVFTPTRTYGLGLKQNLSHGISYDLSVSGDQRSADSLNIDTGTTAKINLDLKIDLWNDFLGSRTKRMLDIGDLNEKRSKLKNDLDTKRHLLTIRRLYWQLVAFKESLKLTDQIYTLAKKQVKEIKKRQRNSIADKATVALFSSQLVSRSAQKHRLNYNYEMTLRKLKTMLPSLNDKELKFGKYDIDGTVGKVLQCTAIINSHMTAPVKFTSVDEMVSLLKEIQKKEMAVTNTHSNIDVFMEANVRNTGVNSPGSTPGTMSDAISDFQDNDRKGYDVGLFVNIPLGKQKKTTEEVKKDLVRNKYISLMESMSANLNSTHTQIKKTTNLLVGLIKDQRENNRHLNTRLKEVNKKYKQARINYTDYIADQNSYLSSELAVIDTELMILNTIFDYIEVFTELPCGLNTNI